MGIKKVVANAFFFDIGGVLLSNAWGAENRRRAAEVFNLNIEALENQHQAWFYMYEIGHISLEEYIDYAVFYEPQSFSRKAFKEFLFDQSQELPFFLSWLKEWKKTCTKPVFSLNNEGKELNDYRIEKFSLNQCFDGFFPRAN